MQSLILRAWLFLLAAIGISFSAQNLLLAQQLNPSFASTAVAGINPGADKADQSHWNKLLRGEKVFEEFQAAPSGRARVKVNLVEPDALHATDWQSEESRKSRRKLIVALQEPVLEQVNGPEIKVRHRFEHQAGFSAEVSPNALEKLLQNPRVESVEPVRILKGHVAQGIALMNAMAARTAYKGAGVAIAICDTGIDYRHARLGGGGFPNTKIIGGYNIAEQSNNTLPTGDAHGTACAGIAAGNVDSMWDYIGGVAPAAKIYALKVTSGSSDEALDDDIIAAWNWCVSHQYDNRANPILVVSTSFGSGRYYSSCDATEPSFKQAARNLANAGITVLCSGGNEGYCDSIVSPACISQVISVGAVYDSAFGIYRPCVESESCGPLVHTTGCSTGYVIPEATAADKVAAYCNVASILTILAPGNKAYTTDIIGSSGFASGDYYPDFGGTSAACAYAAGAVAVLQSAAHAMLGRYLTPDEVRLKLTSLGDFIKDSKAGIAKPRVNLGRMVESLRVPGDVTLAAPADNQNFGTGAKPQFAWVQQGMPSDWYNIYMNRNGSKYIDAWCAAESPYSSAWTPASSLVGGNYSWWVRGWNTNGFGNWSQTGHFTIETCFAGTPAAIAPQGTSETNSAVTYTWTADACSVWYELYVMRNGALFVDTWCKRTDLPATNNQLSFLMTGHKSGTYNWWIRGWSADGLGAWSSGASFAVALQLPGTVNLLRPSQGENVTNWITPEFSWSQANPTASWYCLSINRNGSMYQSEWIERMSRCVLTNAFLAGTYTWKVQGWNPEGLGQWSSAGQFTVSTRVPAAITQLSPVGAMRAGTMDYTWRSDFNATWYEVYVCRNGTLFLDKWYSKDDLAFLSPGQLTAHVTAIHGSGNYTWWLRGWGPDGMGPWSGAMSFSIP